MKTRAAAHDHELPASDPGATPPGRASRTQRRAARFDDATRRAQHAILDAAWSAPVQLARDAHTGLDDGEIQSAAAHGVGSGGGALPHLDAIQRAFGPHDVSGITAHVGGAAREASEAIGAHAYATGDHVAFAEAPSLLLAAHEAAHVVQQRAGVQLSGAVGQAGDAYEQHADAVAARVVAGESAADLLGPVVGDASGGVQRAAVQRKTPGRGTEDDDLLAMSNHAYFLEALGTYTAYASFRSLGAGGTPVTEVDLADPALDRVARTVREVVLAIQDDRRPDHLKLALDRWGPIRPQVIAVLERIERRWPGLQRDLRRAREGVDRVDTYAIDGAAQQAIDQGAAAIAGDFKVAAKLHQAEYGVARSALLAAFQVLDRGRGLPGIDDVRKDVPHLDATVNLVRQHETIEPALTAAEKIGLALKHQHPMEWPRHVLRVAKFTLKGVSLLAGSAWRVGPEAGQLFRQFAVRAMEDSDLLLKSTAFLGQAINVLQVAKGVYDLVGGVVSGDMDQAITGARNVLIGGSSILMEAAGAGLGASMTSIAVGYIFVETIRECIAVGKLLREIPHVQEVIAVTRFVEAAANHGDPGARAYAALAERYAGHTYATDPGMQASVQAQIEVHMKLEAAKLIAGIRKDVRPRYHDRSVYGLGRYPDAIAAMGPDAVGALNYIVDRGDDVDPGTVAFSAVKLFRGIGRMGQWAQVAHGTGREQEGNRRRRQQLDQQIEGEWQRERDQRSDWSRPPPGPTDAQLEESSR